jgi:hypothetical protein
VTESEQNPQLNIESSVRIETAIEVRPLYALASAAKIPIILSHVPHERTTFEEFDRETRLGAEVVCAAICQQMNWDYLRGAVHRELSNGDSWWRPQEIGQVGPALVVKLLSSYVSYSPVNDAAESTQERTTRDNEVFGRFDYQKSKHASNRTYGHTDLSRPKIDTCK